MKKAARRLRKSRNQPFYSMRESAHFFAVHLSTMALAYQQLENEGLIVRIRGAGTILLGKVAHVQHPARGVVSIPLPLQSFISSRFTRTFSQCIGAELWKHHWVANLALCDESMDMNTVSGHLRQSDVMLWVFPTRSRREAILTLRDQGVRNIILLSVEDIFVPAHYVMDWTPAYRQAIVDWRARGIGHVIVAQATHPDTRNVIDGFLRILREKGCAFTLTEADPFRLRDRVEYYVRKKTPVGCAILEHETSHQLCNSEPVIMAKLTTQCRVLFGRGCIYAPYFFHREFRADVIGFVGDEVAARVAGDLGRRAPCGAPITLSPEWMPDVKLSEVFI